MSQTPSATSLWQQLHLHVDRLEAATKSNNSISYIVD